MEAARTSETSVDIQLRTRQYIPEDSELQLDIWYDPCSGNQPNARPLPIQDTTTQNNEAKHPCLERESNHIYSIQRPEPMP
jgi:hypothetical protein